MVFKMRSTIGFATLLVFIFSINYACNSKSQNNKNDLKNDLEQPEHKSGIWLDKEKEEMHTIFTEGTGKEVALILDISKQTMKKIIDSEEYKITCKDTSFLNGNILKGVSEDTLALHLMSLINSSAFAVKRELTNPTSLKIPDGQKGMIYFEEKELVLSYSITSQNEIGNMIYNNAIIIRNKAYVH